MSDQQPAQSSDGLRAQAVRGAGQAMTAALIVLAAAVGLALWQHPADPLVILQAAALLTLAAGAATRWWLRATSSAAARSSRPA